MFARERLKTNEDLAKIVEDAKNSGKKVVFTNGVFDFLHVGHVTYLEKARELGDMLVLGVNSDASVKRIKGPERPINKEADRAQVLAALECVDYVTVFAEDTPTNIIDIIKPSIHAKGGDYDPEKMPETATVRKHGGDVKIIPLEDGYSNSNQFKKIKDSEKDKNFERPDWLAGAQK